MMKIESYTVSRWSQESSNLRQRPTPEQWDCMCFALRLKKNERKRLARWFENKYRRAVTS